MITETVTTYRCEKCGELFHNKQLTDEHKCNPVLYQMVLKLRFNKKLMWDKKPVNCNGNADLVARELGISRGLADHIVDEMEERGLVNENCYGGEGST